MPPLPALTETLSDGVVELRAISEWDIPEILIAHQDDPGLSARIGLTRPPSSAMLGTEVDRADAERVAGATLSLTIVEPGQRDCRGRVTVSEVDWAARRARVRVWVAPQLRGRGVGRRAVALAGGWLARSAGIEQLEC